MLLQTHHKFVGQCSSQSSFSADLLDMMPLLIYQI
jgi:hypothetical protein